MTHLRRLAIRSYRSIVKADLKLGEVTVIVGGSDTGKSCVVRALRDWAFNAGGSTFATKGFRITRVACAVGERFKVVWEKGIKGKNSSSRYVLADGESGEKLSYEKIGLTVPEEVLEVTRVRHVVADDVKVAINFAQQGKPWFLLQSPPWTPARVSRVIGLVSGVDSLLLAHRDLVNKRNAASRESKHSQGRVDRGREELSKFSTLDAARELLDEAKEEHAKLLSLQAKLTRATSLLRTLRDKRTWLRGTREFLTVVTNVDEVGEEFERSCVQLVRAESLMSKGVATRKRLKEAQGKIRLAEGQLEGCAVLLRDLAGDVDLLCPLCGGGAHAECRKALSHEATEAEPR